MDETENITDSRTGEMIGGRYLIGPLLGQGAHGEVYRARDTIDLVDVAIKFLAQHLTQASNFHLRLIREARALEALKGKAAVEVLGLIGAEDGTPCLVMEMLDGQDLGQALTERDKPLSKEQMVSMFSPVVETMTAAHDMGIVHRDIKPSNIFLVDTNFSNPKLMDFGLAKLADLTAITADNMLAGSPSYIAPEIWRHGAHDADERADVYSIACVMYECLTLHPPIQRDRLVDMLVAVTDKNNRPKLRTERPDFPPRVEDWMEQAFAVDPADRFQRVEALWNAFRSVTGY